MKLDQEPRLSNGPSLFASLVDWARSVVRSVNSLYDSFLSAIGTPRTGALSITETLDAPAFAAYRNATPMALTTAAFNGIIFNAEELDTAGAFNTSTGVFNPKVAGWYWLASTVSISCVSGSFSNMQIHIYKNGATKRRGDVSVAANNNYWAGCASALLYFNGTTDYAQIVVYLSGGTTNNAEGDVDGVSTHFSGYLARRA